MNRLFVHAECARLKMHVDILKNGFRGSAQDYALPVAREAQKP